MSPEDTQVSSSVSFQDSNDKQNGNELESGRAEKKTPSDALNNAQQFDPDDAESPRNWNVKKRILVSLFALYTPFVATFATPIYIAAVPSIYQEFHVSTTTAIAPLSLYAFGVGIGSLIGTAASEIYGRRVIFQVTLPVFFAFTLVGGFSKNIETLAVARIISGCFAGPLMTTAIGMVNDIWDVVLEKTGDVFCFDVRNVYDMGNSNWSNVSIVKYGWEWTFWLTAILIGISLIFSWIIPETFEPQLLRARALKLNQPLPARGSKTKIFLTAVGRPIHMMIVEPIIFPSAFVISITQAVCFAYYVEYALMFERVYGFTAYEAGMAFAPMLVGSIFALLAMGLSDRLLYQPARDEALRSGGTVAPEKRLYPAMMGSIVLPIALFWFAWTGRKSVHWIVPVLSGIPFAFAYVVNIFCFPLYVNDIYTRRYGASCQATNNFMRFTVAASFPLFTVQLVDKLGFAWATSLFGFVAVAMIPVPWVFFKWGPGLRSRSQYLRAILEEEVK